jgi:hypothetical protein
MEARAGELREEAFRRYSRDVLPERGQQRPHRLARPRTSPFHGGNGGSNPPGDAISRTTWLYGLYLPSTLTRFQKFVLADTWYKRIAFRTTQRPDDVR